MAEETKPEVKETKSEAPKPVAANAVKGKDAPKVFVKPVDPTAKKEYPFDGTVTDFHGLK